MKNDIFFLSKKINTMAYINDVGIYGEFYNAPYKVGAFCGALG